MKKHRRGRIGKGAAPASFCLSRGLLTQHTRQLRKPYRSLAKKMEKQTIMEKALTSCAAASDHSTMSTRSLAA